jgi:hypothetical protein
MVKAIALGHQRFGERQRAKSMVKAIPPLATSDYPLER